MTMTPRAPVPPPRASARVAEGVGSHESSAGGRVTGGRARDTSCRGEPLRSASTIPLALVAGLAACASCEPEPTTDRSPAPETLADPPVKGVANPHDLQLSQVAPAVANLGAAERLYQRGLEKGADDGYWDFAECVAFHPNHPPCHRALGIAAAPRRFDDEAIRQLETYLHLVPDAVDAPDVQREIARLRADPDGIAKAPPFPCAESESLLIVTTKPPRSGCSASAAADGAPAGPPVATPARICVEAGVVTVVVRCEDGSAVHASLDVGAGLAQIVELTPERDE